MRRLGQPRHVHNLSRIEDPFWIQRTLDDAHDIHRLLANLEEQTLLLAPANRVLASACALHVERAVDHVVHALFHLFALTRIFTVVHDAFVEVSIANVAEDAGEQAQVVHLLLTHLNNVCETAQRDGDIRAP